MDTRDYEVDQDMDTRDYEVEKVMDTRDCEVDKDKVRPLTQKQRNNIIKYLELSQRSAEAPVNLINLKRSISNLKNYYYNKKITVDEFHRKEIEKRIQEYNRKKDS